MQTIFTIQTSCPGLYEFTSEVSQWVDNLNIEQGLLTLFCRHTSCSVLIQENADPNVKRDMIEFFRRLVPPSDDPSRGWIIHTAEGPDDMPAHIKAALTPVCLSIPIMNSQLALGTWQGIFLFEHRDRPHTRQVVGHITI